MLVDTYNRPVKDLRISVTDRCNFRCTYCMPLDEYVWVEHKEILTFEEITRLVRLFVQLGVEELRITGGEPLLRRDLDVLVAQLAAIDGLHDICLTTNGALLAEQAAGLKAAGLTRVNVSLDTLDAAKFKRITKRGQLEKVLAGLFEAQRVGLQPIKINAVIERGVNDDEILALVEFSREHGFALRFIEYMDVGNANNWKSDKLVSKKEIITQINTHYPLREGGRQEASAPAVNYQFSDERGDIGVIASVTEPFCADCTRARITAEGKLVTCLFSPTGHELKKLLRNGTSDEQLLELISTIWRNRTDRYSEERLTALNSPAGYEAKLHKKIEMIRLGG